MLLSTGAAAKTGGARPEASPVELAAQTGEVHSTTGTQSAMIESRRWCRAAGRSSCR